MLNISTSNKQEYDNLARAALTYASYGWKVLPLHSAEDGKCTCGKADCPCPGKHPRILDWQNKATSDGLTIKHWLGMWPNSNIGIVTGKASGIVVLDVDPRHGGDESLDELKASYGPFPDTVESITGGGGRHIFFRYPGEHVGNSTGKLGPGLDIKADGGFIVAPLSLHISGKRYTWEASSHPDDVALADMPRWLVERVCQGPVKKFEVAGSDPIPEGVRNTTLTRLAGSVRRKGASQAGIQALLIEENKRCQPPLNEDEIARIAASISRYPAEATAATDAPAVVELQPFALPISEFMSGPADISWLWDGLMADPSLMILVAKPKFGKTLLSFNLAIAASKGDTLLGRPVKKVNVLILQLEDPPVVIRDRLKRMGAEDLNGVFIRAGLPMSSYDWDALVGFIREHKIGLVIIDPFAFALRVDENDSSKVAGFMRKLREIIFATGCSTLVVHHHRKSAGEAGDQIRGSSAILGAVDVALELRRENEETPTATLEVTSRFANVKPQLLTLDLETLTWKSRGSAGDYKRQKQRQAIREALQKEKSGADTEQLEGLLGKTKPTFYNDLKEMVSDGEVLELRQQPTEKGGRPKIIYRLSPWFRNHAEDDKLQNSPQPDHGKPAAERFCSENKNPGVEKNLQNPGTDDKPQTGGSSIAPLRFNPDALEPCAKCGKNHRHAELTLTAQGNLCPDCLDMK